MIEKQIKLFPAQKANERVLMVIRRHWFTYIVFWFLALTMSLPLILGLILIPANLSQISDTLLNVMILGGSAYVLLILALLLYGFIDFYLDIYIVTDRRIVDIKQNGFFNRAIAELNLHQVQDVKASVKGFFPTLLHYGEVLIQTAGERENFNFKDVHHPYRISKLIMDLHENALSQNDYLPDSLEKEQPVEAIMQDFMEGSPKNEPPKEETRIIKEPPKEIESKKNNKADKKQLGSKRVSGSNSIKMEEGKAIKLNK